MGDFNSASFYGDETKDLRGVPGAPGEPGKQGEPGPRGEDGKDIVTLWQDQGNTGGLDALLEGLRGQTGRDGRDGKSTFYRFGGFAVADILSGEIILDHVVAEPCTLGANFYRSIADASTPPEVAPWVAEVTKNGLAIGSVSINASGKGVLTTTGAAPVSLSPGDYVTVTAPRQPDAKIGRLRVTFVA